MNPQRMDEILERVERLPPLSTAMLRLIEVIDRPNSTMQEIVETIRFDQTITAEVLRLCGSAYYARSRRVASLDDAVTLLGTTRVLQLALAAHTRSLLGRPQSGYGLAPGELWTHSVGVALACRRLAENLASGERSTLFTAGLLHDMGKIVLNEFVSEEYAQIVARVAAGEGSFSDAEQEILGFTHAEVGARLAEAWRLAPPIVACIRHHHQPQRLTLADANVDRVHLADAICRTLGVGGGDDGPMHGIQPQALQRTGLTRAALEQIGVATIAELKLVLAEALRERRAT